MKAKYKVVSFYMPEPARQNKHKLFKRDVRVDLITVTKEDGSKEISISPRSAEGWNEIVRLSRPEITFEHDVATILIRGLFGWGNVESPVYQEGWVRLTP